MLEESLYKIWANANPFDTSNKQDKFINCTKIKIKPIIKKLDILCFLK